METTPARPASTRTTNLAHFVTQARRRYPERLALVRGDRTWTWARFAERIDAMAAALVTRFGVRKGDRILVQSANSHQLFESMFACFRIGAVWVPANYRQTPDDIAYLAQASGAVGMLCQTRFPAHARASRARGPALRFVIGIPGDDGVCEPGSEPGFDRGSDTSADTGADTGFDADYEALVDEHAGQAAALADVDRDDPCWYFFTSGTTGRPKAAILTHGQMAFVVTNHLCDLMPGTTAAGDASLVVAPLSHGAGIHQLAQVARGVTTVLMPTDRLDPAVAWALVERWRISNLFTVPTILKRLVEDPAVDRHDHRSLRYVIYAGAPMLRADQKRALEKLGPVIVQYFGLGEVTGNITVLTPADHRLDDDAVDLRLGTCGVERVGMQVSIQDDDGNELPAGRTGEICVTGPAVFAGYLPTPENPDANAKAFRNGWFRTGDLGHLDPQGYLYITGRSSDMYICGGSNIYPREIEEVLSMHPAIAEVAVIGVPDPAWGEVGVAVCVPRTGASDRDGATLAGEIGTWLLPRIARYKQPRRYVFWTEMPKSGYGKITKPLIRQALIERGELPPPGPAPDPG